MTANIRKTALAFVIAPAWVPLLAVVFAMVLWNHPAQRQFVLLTAIVATVFTYGGTFLLGLPAFLILLRLGKTDFWTALVLGFAIGVMTGIVCAVTFSFLLGGHTSLVASLPMLNNPATIGVAAMMGFAGTIVGALLWLIARPDTMSNRE